MKKYSTLLAGLTALAAASAVVVAAANKPAPSGGLNWSNGSVISPQNQPDPTRGSQLNDVAVNASGLTIAAWDQFTYNAGGGATVGAAVQAGGRWQPPFTISGSTGFSMSPRVAVGDDGTMAVSWTWEDATLTAKRVEVAVKPAGAAGWSTSTIDTSGVGGVSVTDLVPIGIDAGGNITAAWTIWNGVRHEVRVATRSKSGAWSAPMTVSGPTTDAMFPSLAVNARGDAAVVYSLSPWSGWATGTWAEHVSRQGPNGAWTAPVMISNPMSSNVGYIMNPQVALDAAGLATAIYTGFGIQAVRQLSANTWTPPVIAIQAPNAVSSYLSMDLALDSAGNAVLGASIFDATVGVDRASVYVALGTPDGNWRSQQRITDPSAPVDAYATRVAMSPDGSLAMVGWVDHYHGTVQVSKLSGTAWGTANTIGRGTAFSSFQEMLGLEAGSGSVARAIWKSVKGGGTQTIAASYGR